MSALPFISIVIPTYARPKNLSNCLQSLLRLEYPPDSFEVIVVDDGSEPPIQSLVDSYQHKLDVATIRQRNAGPATARNAGANRACGAYIVFTDDDCALASDYLAKLARRVKDKPAAMIGGRTINALPNNLCATTSQLLIEYLYRYFNTGSEKTTLFTSNNMIVPASQFNAIKGFDTSFPLAAGEDRELCDRWQHEYGNMLYAEELLVYHSHAMTLGSFWRQHFNYGRGAFYFHQRRSKRGRLKDSPEPLMFYFNLLHYPLTLERGWRQWLIVLLLSASQVANALGFFWEMWKKK